MKLNKEAKNVETIVIQQNENEFVQERIRVDALSKMGHLELLILNNVKCFETLDISNELRYLCWGQFPWMSLPSTFHLDQLVELILPRSNIKQLWKGKKCLPNLTKLDLNHSKNLIEVPDLSEVPLLMDLNLEGCIKLVQIHPSIGILRQLRHLRLRNCKNLIEVPNLSEVERLTDLTLEGCIEVVHIDSSIGNLRELIYLNLKNCKNLVLNLNILFGISSLETLILSGCSNLHNNEIGNLSSLIVLNLGGNKFVTLPNTIKRLSNLYCLNLEHCKQLEYLPELPTVKERFIDEPMSLYIFDCPKLRDMEHCYNLSEVPRLERLHLEGCIQLVEIHPSIGILRELRYLNLKNCKNLVLNLNMLFGISSLSGLNLSGCSKLLNSKMLMEPRDTKHLEEIVKITNAIQFPTSSVYKLLMLPFNFLYPPKPEDSLGLFLPNLTMLDMRHSKYLIAVPDLSEVPRLERLHLEGCIQLVEIHPSIGILRELRYLNLKNCKNLVLNLNMLFGISSLSGLNLSGCSKLLNSKMLMEPRDTKHLEEIVKITNAIQFPTSSVYKLLMLPFNFLYPPKPEDSLGLVLSLSSVPCLVYLDISFCNLLRIPDEIGNLHSLVGLNLGGNKFVTLPSTIKQLSNLQRLNLEHCKQLKYLPELPTIKQKNIGGYYGLGLNIFDCTKLSDMEHCYSMVFSWMTQNLQVFFQPTISSARIEMEIVIPGSEIPKWFNKQSASRSISMDPSDVIDDPNLIGVAICVLFVTHQDPINLGERDDDRFSTFWFSVNNSKRREYMGVPIYFKKDLVTVGLDHLFTVFYSRQEFIHVLSTPPNTMHELHQTEFGTSTHNPKGLRVVVKKCGYRWVFKEDLQQFNSNMFFSTNSSSRKRKF
ncbi:maintenance of ploidy protein MOB1 [Vigna unguiculata]|uniref:Maintenance of ploidy protein MOB1 n=1 Tax=Vigna unguiculata TaxID=3917 RepID=A0A4D6LFS4_VIGUN|nr:maintenance of ploidy protein MOB1 [Vigna unguiculata]